MPEWIFLLSMVVLFYTWIGYGLLLGFFCRSLGFQSANVFEKLGIERWNRLDVGPGQAEKLTVGQNLLA